MILKKYSNLSFVLSNNPLPSLTVWQKRGKGLHVWICHNVMSKAKLKLVMPVTWKGTNKKGMVAPARQRKFEWVIFYLFPDGGGSLGNCVSFSLIDRCRERLADYVVFCLFILFGWSTLSASPFLWRPLAFYVPCLVRLPLISSLSGTNSAIPFQTLWIFFWPATSNNLSVKPISLTTMLTVCPTFVNLANLSCSTASSCQAT